MRVTKDAAVVWDDVNRWTGTTLNHPFSKATADLPIPEPGGTRKPWMVFDIAGGWGDVFMVSGVAREIKQAFPEIRIEYHLAEQQHSLLDVNPDFDILLPPGAELVAEDYALVQYPTQFRELWRTPGWHWMRILCRTIGLNFDPYTLRRVYYAQPEELLWAKKFLSEYEPPWTFLHPYTTPWTKIKQWDKANWEGVTDDIPGTTFLMGKDDEGNEKFVEDKNVVSLEEQHTFRQSAALLHFADLVVCMDSAVANTAEAVGSKNVVTLYGATTPQMVGLFTPRAVNLEPRSKPCGRKADECWVMDKDCETPCVNLITPTEVKQAIGNVYDPPERVPLEFVIVNWNSGEMTARVLEDLAKTCETIGYKVTVVDNGSDRLDVKKVASAMGRYHKRRAKLIHNKVNKGFPAAVNDALAQSTAEVVCLLNPDIEIHEAGWDKRLLAMFDVVPRAGIIGCGKTEGAYFFGPNGDSCKWNKTMRCDRVNGATMAIHRRCLDKVPWLDEIYSPGLCEETDYCIRAQALGFEVWWFPANIVHLGGQVVAENQYSWSTNHRRNVETFDKRWSRFQMPFTGNVPKGY